jgi:hypothetical protein
MKIPSMKQVIRLIDEIYFKRNEIYKKLLDSHFYKIFIKYKYYSSFFVGVLLLTIFLNSGFSINTESFPPHPKLDYFQQQIYEIMNNRPFYQKAWSSIVEKFENYSNDVPHGNFRFEQNGDEYKVTASEGVVVRPYGNKLDFDYWANGTKHILSGNIYLAGYEFVGDKSDPLIFKVDKNSGYIFIRGKGSVKLLDGEIIHLNRPWFLWFWRN